MTICISVIIPARNEAALIARTVESVLTAVAVLQEAHAVEKPLTEVIVVDNASTDHTLAVIQRYQCDGRIHGVMCSQLGSARARNAGARQAQGDILVFLDADTLMPPDALCTILWHCTIGNSLAGITGLAAAEGGIRATLWWWFWCQIRRLPLARAKAMPALMFCTRSAFADFGPFDEAVSIGEEWPILAGVYRSQRQRFIYERSLVARSSSRRMELQPFGYTRTFGRYLWAVLHRSGRIGYSDRIRHDTLEAKEHHNAGSVFSDSLRDRLRSRPIVVTPRCDGDTTRIVGDNR
jgi:glycosyltransferase involved in cell wall biosynthesis